MVLADRFRRVLPGFLVFLACRLHHVVLVHLLVLVVLPRRFHPLGPGVPSDQAHHVDLQFPVHLSVLLAQLRLLNQVTLAYPARHVNLASLADHALPVDLVVPLVRVGRIVLCCLAVRMAPQIPPRLVRPVDPLDQAHHADLARHADPVDLEVRSIRALRDFRGFLFQKIFF